VWVCVGPCVFVCVSGVCLRSFACAWDRGVRVTVPCGPCVGVGCACAFVCARSVCVCVCVWCVHVCVVRVGVCVCGVCALVCVCGVGVCGCACACVCVRVRAPNCVCNPETSTIRKPTPEWRCGATNKLIQVEASKNLQVKF